MLYTRADKPKLEIDNLGKYQISTQRVYKRIFNFNISETNTVKQGIETVLAGRVEGYLMVQNTVDSYIRKNNINNIRRVFYRSYDSSFIISKGKKGVR